ATFKDAITECLDKTHTDHKSELDSLLVPRFQLFRKPQIDAT
ncbi:MAG: IS630 family transposase, partial [bacterium]|nr:IS630 family transposase [bacterium]